MSHIIIPTIIYAVTNAAAAWPQTKLAAIIIRKSLNCRR